MWDCIFFLLDIRTNCQMPPAMRSMLIIAPNIIRTGAAGDAATEPSIIVGVQAGGDGVLREPSQYTVIGRCSSVPVDTMVRLTSIRGFRKLPDASRPKTMPVKDVAAFWQ